MEGLEVRVDVQRGLHAFKAGGEGHIHASPHILRDGFEGARAGVNFGVKGSAAGGTAAMGVEEDVPCVLEEDGAVEVYEVG